jgi:hypothetical protein
VAIRSKNVGKQCADSTSGEEQTLVHFTSLYYLSSYDQYYHHDLKKCTPIISPDSHTEWHDFIPTTIWDCEIGKIALGRPAQDPASPSLLLSVLDNAKKSQTSPVLVPMTTVDDIKSATLVPGKIVLETNENLHFMLLFGDVAMRSILQRIIPETTHNYTDACILYLPRCRDQVQNITQKILGVHSN